MWTDILNSLLVLLHKSRDPIQHDFWADIRGWVQKEAVLNGPRGGHCVRGPKQALPSKDPDKILYSLRPTTVVSS